MDKRKENSAQRRNEGEGNRTAAREYNRAQQHFIRSRRVDDAAKQAERDVRDDNVRRELEQAEAIGRRHSAEEDPEIRRSYKKD